MASTQERDELRRLIDELSDDDVHNVLGVVHLVSHSAGGVSTVSFELDGVEYEIDLTSENAERLRESVVVFIDACMGRRSQSTVTTTESGQAKGTPRMRERPAWIGAGHLGPDFASRAKDVLRDEMGRRNA